MVVKKKDRKAFPFVSLIKREPRFYRLTLTAAYRLLMRRFYPPCGRPPRREQKKISEHIDYD